MRKGRPRAAFLVSASGEGIGDPRLSSVAAGTDGAPIGLSMHPPNAARREVAHDLQEPDRGRNAGRAAAGR
ncbi:MAG: hypothetical protein AB7P02_22605, partial [Alphaproteobacteria bacterium]